MSFDKLSWIGFLSLLRKEIFRYLKVASQILLSPSINSGLYMIIFGVSLGPHIRSPGEFSYLEFLIPGLIAMSALDNSLQNSASSIIISKFHNDLQDLRVVPLQPGLITLAYALASWSRGLICSLAVFIVGQSLLLITAGRWMPIENIFVLFFFLTASSFFFGCIGIWAGFWANSFDQLNVITRFVILPLIYLGGVFYSLDILPGFWRQLVLFNPLVYMINGIRWGFLSLSEIPIEVCAGAAVLFSLFSFLLAWQGVRKGDYLRF